MTTTIHWLGNGSGLNLTLDNTSFYLHAAGPRLAVVDCGYTVPPRLHALGLIEKVTDVILTHLHADHAGGLETLGSLLYYALRRRGHQLPWLHLPTDEMAHELWQHSMRAGLFYASDENNEPMDANLETFFRVSTGSTVRVDGLPSADYVPSRHVPRMPNYSLHFDNNVFYSGDSCDLPPFDADLIFQDVHFAPPYPAEVHASYHTLREQMPPDARKKTWLVHLGNGYEKFNPEKDGFAGFVKPGQEFSV